MMRPAPGSRLFGPGLLVAGILASAALPHGPAPATATEARGPVVIELFTSQSCYSCPPAEQLLGELASEPGIVALEWHVDYWDDLVYGAAGKWKDPYSDPAFTRRQRTYNQHIRDTGRVYTPQMVVDGSYEAVGSRRAEVAAAIGRAREHPATAQVGISAAADGSLEAQIGGEDGGAASVWHIGFIEERTTEVLRGENKGKSLANHHVVTHMEKLADWAGGPLSLSVPRPGEGMGCAVLIQFPDTGRIAGAALCPGYSGS